MTHIHPLPTRSGGRALLDLPGLPTPVTHLSTILTDGEPGQRAVLVLATESGEQLTTRQLGILADALDSLYGEETPEGSRAWLRAELAQLREQVAAMRRADTLWQRRAETAEALVRDRSQLTDAQQELERQGLELIRTREAFRERQRRVDGLWAEREELAGRVEELTAMLEQVRHERDEANSDANRYAAVLTGLEQERDKARQDTNQLLDQLAMQRAVIRRLQAAAQAATQSSPLRSAVASAARALHTLRRRTR